MAHISILDDAQGAVAGQDLVEGRMVSLSASGLHHDLPTALYAASGTTKDVYMVFVSPDQFPRPTYNGMFAYPDTMSLNPRDATNRYKTTDYEYGWLIGPSVLPTPTAQSGWKVQLHRGGMYKLLSGEFNDSAGIKAAGAKVRVGASGILEYDSTGANAIGSVREYNVYDGSLTVAIKEL